MNRPKGEESEKKKQNHLEGEQLKRMYIRREKEPLQKMAKDQCWGFGLGEDVKNELDGDDLGRAMHRGGSVQEGEETCRPNPQKDRGVPAP